MGWEDRCGRYGEWGSIAIRLATRHAFNNTLAGLRPIGNNEFPDIGMAATLLGGLSLGLSGSSFWSHDIGGFTAQTPKELYRRWLPFGMLSSHSRSHGAPPKEPWKYGADFTDAFRRAAEMRYRLMPYIYSQAKDSTHRGLPMLRALVSLPADNVLHENVLNSGSDNLACESNPLAEHTVLTVKAP